MRDDIRQRLASLPSAPGVYLMKDAQGRILYVGKAKDLKKRVHSYFRKGKPKDLKTKILTEKIATFETMVTSAEKEAFLLESNLIKTHRPRYNVVLKDDKRYPCLRLNIESPYPNLTIVRKPKKDGALYFGPFASAGAVRETLKLIHRTFRLRKCKAGAPKHRERPCLNYQMGLCLGPCSQSVDPAEYQAVVNEVILFLRGRMPELVRNVRSKMEAAASEHKFEVAAAYRDKLFALEKTLEKQVVFTSDFKDRDVIGLARQGNCAQIMTLLIRGGFLLGSRPFHFAETMAGDGELMASFVKQYYENTPFIPKEILLSVEPKDRMLLEMWLREQKGEKVSIMRPRKGEKAKLVEMASQNATMHLRENLNTVFVQDEMLARVQKRLGLERRPDRIECFDLSNVAGTQGVGSMVVFDRGMPLPEGYRKYRIRKAAERDDYAMLEEVLIRRYKEESHREFLPDLLIVDGGKGHLNVAVSVLKSLGIYGAFDLIGIAKKDPQQGDIQDKIYKPGRKNPLNLLKEPEVLLFLQRIRDEAHRYVVTYHRKRRLMTYRRSVLEGIPGIGIKRRSRLLRHFGSLKRLQRATFEELLAVPGMTRPAVESLMHNLKSKTKGPPELNCERKTRSCQGAK